MPIYEFRCLDCRRKTTSIVLVRARIGEVRCDHCGGANLERLVSCFATPKSEDARLDALADPSALGDVNENDPASVARWMKRMGKEMGEDLGGDIDEAIEEEMSRGESGEEPDGGFGSGGDAGGL
jgi:putative FmdB family regulatory protein